MSIDKVLVRIIDQIENLVTYFLVTLPRQKTFKKVVADSKRYQRIKENLSSKYLLPYMHFVVFVAYDFRSFLLPFQSAKPMIHLLHIKQGKLFKSIVEKFVDSKFLINVTKKVPLPIAKLLDLKLEDTALHKSRCDVGTKTKQLLGKLEPLEAKKFYGCADG